jgi:hypothetical protein
MLRGPVYEHVRLRMPLLLLLDELLSDDSFSYNYPVISIEHVLPQNPRNDSIWREWWPNEDTRNSWIHKIGNLTLLSRRKNSSAGNLDYEEKLEKYFVVGGISNFGLNKDIQSGLIWNEDLLALRQERLVQKLLDYFSE